MTKIIRRDHVLQAARILVACGMAWAGAWAFGLKETYWALITALVVAQPGLQKTLVAGRDRVIGTILGAAAGLLIIEAVRRGWPQTPLFLIAFVLSTLATAIWPNMRVSGITLIIVILVPAAGPDFGRPLDRVYEIMIGTAASILAAVLIAERAKARPD